MQRQQFFGLVTLFKRAVSARRRDARYGGGVYACFVRAGRGKWRVAVTTLQMLELADGKILARALGAWQLTAAEFLPHS